MARPPRGRGAGDYQCRAECSSPRGPIRLLAVHRRRCRTTLQVPSWSQVRCYRGLSWTNASTIGVLQAAKFIPTTLQSNYAAGSPPEPQPRLQSFRSRLAVGTRSALPTPDHADVVALGHRPAVLG